jgi:hypothetical protein
MSTRIEVFSGKRHGFPEKISRGEMKCPAWGTPPDAYFAAVSGTNFRTLPLMQ